jgi:hypothetical protein
MRSQAGDPFALNACNGEPVVARGKRAQQSAMTRHNDAQAVVEVGALMLQSVHARTREGGLLDPATTIV